MLLSQLTTFLKSEDSKIKDCKIFQDIEIKKGASIEIAEECDVTFLEINSPLQSKLKDTKASFILLPDKIDLKTIANELQISWAVCDNPKLIFAETLRILIPKYKNKLGIHPQSVIGENVIFGKDVSIGPNTFIGDNSKIGDNSIVHPGVVIYDNVIIGSNNELHANCVIHPNSTIKNNCIIHSNAVIGSEGFGFIPTNKGWEKMPQTGSVVIEDDVEVGANTNIDRPSVGETYIGSGTKIDNLVQIGHGVRIGKDCAMASQVGIAGGAQIGNSVILAGQVGVANRVIVGDKVVASSKCGIHTDIEKGSVISGFPAMSNRLWLRCSANFKKLPEFAKSIRQFNRINSN